MINIESQISTKYLIETTIVPHTAFDNATQRIAQCLNYSDEASEPIGIALIGESRTGKSRLLEDFECQHNPTRDENGINKKIIRVKTPSKPTVKSLVELMLREIKDPIFTNGTENSKTIRLKCLMNKTGIKMVMIDEFQHFYDKGSHKVMHHVADWLKILVDDSKVSLVVAGLPTCKTVIDQNEQLAGRFMAPIILPRFDWSKDTQREEFIGILDAFQQIMEKYFNTPKFSNQEMSFRFYCATGGLIGYLTKLLRQTVWDALDSGDNIIKLKNLSQAYAKSIWTHEHPNPFDDAFSDQPTEFILSQIQKIGAHEPEEPGSESATIKSGRKRRNKMTPSQILSAQ
ncbi:MAG: TniB family NTP-binding protein [Proteobacteria bacterium]|nr:AAA family ATPase [Desulfobulbaceae bacterium]MBU4152643.1 TniB family NTP-binding protein [Pseudomonadota bacterium]